MMQCPNSKLLDPSQLFSVFNICFPSKCSHSNTALYVRIDDLLNKRRAKFKHSTSWRNYQMSADTLFIHKRHFSNYFAYKADGSSNCSR